MYKSYFKEKESKKFTGVSESTNFSKLKQKLDKELKRLEKMYKSDPGISVKVTKDGIELKWKNYKDLITNDKELEIAIEKEIVHIYDEYASENTEMSDDEVWGYYGESKRKKCL